MQRVIIAHGCGSWLIPSSDSTDVETDSTYLARDFVIHSFTLSVRKMGLQKYGLASYACCQPFKLQVIDQPGFLRLFPEDESELEDGSPKKRAKE
jgi:hypothetical protein